MIAALPKASNGSLAAELLWHELLSLFDGRSHVEKRQQLRMLGTRPGCSCIIILQMHGLCAWALCRLIFSFFVYVGFGLVWSVRVPFRSILCLVCAFSVSY